MFVEVASPGRTPMKSLDDPSIYPLIDSTDLRHRLRTLPTQCHDAWDEATAFRLPSEYRNVERVVIVGMGGSAIGGELLADLASLEDSPPLTVCRDYQIPHHVNGNTLLLACSYSGETEETLSSFREGLDKGAKIVAVTGGGTLAREAEERHLPVFRVSYEGEPRAALGYSFIVPTVLLMKLGLISDKVRDFGEAVDVLEQMVPGLAEKSPLQKNPAKEIAADLLDRLVVIYGAGIFGSVARRWKTQFNENSKVWAFVDLLPEAHHNSVVGYPIPAGVRDRTFCILLRPGTLHPRIDLRYGITRELLERESIPHRTLEGQGKSALSQMLSTILLGDYISYYLAILQEVDPSPVATIDYIKQRLGAEKEMS